MEAPALRPLSTGEVLDVAFSLYRRHFVVLALVALASQGVALIFSIYVAASGGSLVNLALTLVSMILSSVCAAIGMGASTKIIADSYLGRPTTAAEALAWVVPSLGKLIGLTVMISIAVMIGFLLIFVPGVILASALAVAPSALVVEGLSANEAMNRSWNLTKGHRWKVFWTMVVAVVLVYAVTLSASIISGVISNVLGAAPLIAVVLATAIAALLSLFVYPFMYAAVTVLYYDLRVRKEGFDLEMLESQLEGK